MYEGTRPQPLTDMAKSALAGGRSRASEEETEERTAGSGHRGQTQPGEEGAAVDSTLTDESVVVGGPVSAAAGRRQTRWMPSALRVA